MQECNVFYELSFHSMSADSKNRRLDEGRRDRLMSLRTSQLSSVQRGRASSSVG